VLSFRLKMHQNPFSVLQSFPDLLAVLTGGAGGRRQDGRERGRRGKRRE